MAVTTLVSSIDRSETYPVAVAVAADNLCGTLILEPNEEWTSQMIHELPTINVSVYSTEDAKLLSVDINLLTYDSNGREIRVVEPYAVPIYNIPDEVVLKVKPLFDYNALQAHNDMIINGSVEIFKTDENGIVDTNMKDYSEEFWTKPTSTFDITVLFDNSNINSGGGSGGGGGSSDSGSSVVESNMLSDSISNAIIADGINYEVI